MTARRFSLSSFARSVAIILSLAGLAAGTAAAQETRRIPPSPTAQDVQRVAAVVNDEVISLRDLENRMKLALLSSNLPDSVEARSRLLPQVLRRLIDEHLELQEAARLKLSVSTAEIATGLATIEQRNNMQPGMFEPLLKSKGIDPETIRQQIRSELAWGQVVRHELRNELHVAEESVDARLAAIKANQGKPEYLVAEIFLAVDNPRHEEEIRTLGERLIEQMRQGAPFAALALQFSQTGAAGGDLGWVSEGMLDDRLMTALSEMRPGQVTPPLRTADGFHILLLRDRRLVGQGLSNGPTVDVLTIELASLPSATAAERDTQLKRLRDSLATGKSCDDFEKLAHEVPSATTSRATEVPVAQVPPAVQALIGTLPIGTVSEPLEGSNSRRMFAVCARHEDTGGLPSRDTIRRRMEDEQFEIMARRYLRDLRRSAFIELRI